MAENVAWATVVHTRCFGGRFPRAVPLSVFPKKSSDTCRFRRPSFDL